MRRISQANSSAQRIRKMRSQVIAASVVALSVAFSLSAWAEPTKLRYAVAVAVPNISAAYYTSLPKLLGYWETENLEIAHSDFSGGTQVAQALVAGSVDVGTMGANAIFSLVQKGVPLAGYYATAPVQYSWPAVLPDSPIKTLADLQGKTFGVPSLENAAVNTAKAYMALGDGDPASLKFLAVGTGSDAMLALQRGDIDALMLWDGPYAEMEERGQPLRLLQDSKLANEAGFQGVIVANRVALKELSDAYVGFARAIAKSLVFIRENPECAVYAHWHAYPASRPSGVPEQDALNQAVRIWKVRERHTGPVEKKWGFSADEHVAANIRMQELAGNIQPGLQPSDVADFSQIDKINDFDAEAVQASARACDFPWKPH